jgi:hypothetical protein
VNILAQVNAELAHRHAVAEQGNGEQQNVGRICEYASDFTPTEHLLIFAIGVSVATPIFGKVSAICFALLFGEKFDTSRRHGDKKESGKPKDDSEDSLL